MSSAVSHRVLMLHPSVCMCMLVLVGRYVMSVVACGPATQVLSTWTPAWKVRPCSTWGLTTFPQGLVRCSFCKATPMTVWMSTLLISGALNACSKHRKGVNEHVLLYAISARAVLRLTCQ